MRLLLSQKGVLWIRKIRNDDGKLFLEYNPYPVWSNDNRIKGRSWRRILRGYGDRIFHLYEVEVNFSWSLLCSVLYNRRRDKKTSFLFTKRMGAPHGLELGWMNPFPAIHVVVSWVRQFPLLKGGKDPCLWEKNSIVTRFWSQGTAVEATLWVYRLEKRQKNLVEAYQSVEQE